MSKNLDKLTTSDPLGEPTSGGYFRQGSSDRPLTFTATPNNAMDTFIVYIEASLSEDDFVYIASLSNETRFLLLDYSVDTLYRTRLVSGGRGGVVVQGAG